MGYAPRLCNLARPVRAFIPRGSARPKPTPVHRERKPRRVRRGSSNLGKAREVYLPLTQSTELRPLCEICVADYVAKRDEYRSRAVFHNILTGRDICARHAVRHVLDSQTKALYAKPGGPS